jgi:hypothetical protein
VIETKLTIEMRIHNPEVILTPAASGCIAGRSYSPSDRRWLIERLALTF